MMRCGNAGGCAPVLACSRVALGTVRGRVHQALKQKLAAAWREGSRRRQTDTVVVPAWELQRGAAEQEPVNTSRPASGFKKGAAGAQGLTAMRRWPGLGGHGVS